MQRLVRLTALESPAEGGVRQYALDFLKEVQNDVESRQDLIDDGTLWGVAEALRSIHKILEAKELLFEPKYPLVTSNNDYRIGP